MRRADCPACGKNCAVKANGKLFPHNSGRSLCPGVKTASQPGQWSLVTVLAAAAFEAAYSERSEVTVAELHSWGRYPAPCRCGCSGCTGWMMGYQWEDALFEDERRTREHGTIYRGYLLTENHYTGNVFIQQPGGRTIMARYDWPSARSYVDEMLGWGPS